MKSLWLEKQAKTTKRGVASLYVVIFATILFGVVTLSFIRIISSESTQSSEDDLSRSAYDAALAGVEDAKAAVNRYYKCLSNGGEGCSNSDRDKLFDADCEDGIGIAKYLYPAYSDGEVKIQESNYNLNGDTTADQAYTCVIVKDTVPDYRGTLTSDTRTKVIPLGVYSENSLNNGGTGSGLSGLTRVRFQWYSRLNEGTGIPTNKQNSEGKLAPSEDATIPPTISLTLVRYQPEEYHNTQFHTADNGANYATMIFVPASIADDGSPYLVNGGELASAGNASSQNKTFKPVCYSTTEFACIVDLDVSSMSLQNNESLFLVASLPYGDEIADFSTSIYTGEALKQFTGVQISVDSTGRTNQLIRRVETRLDPADLFFPYPQYEVELGGDGGSDAFSKNFWITANCWHSHPSSSNGAASACPNNAEISD